MIECKIMKVLSEHDKAFTKPLYRMTQAKLYEYSLNSFRKTLVTLENNGFIEYVHETEYSLPYWKCLVNKSEGCQ